MSAVKDGYVFDIRKLQTFNDGKTLRLSISHNVEPLIGSKWTVGNADRKTCWNSKPKDGGRRVAVFPSSDMLVQLFNEVSTEVNTHHMPVFLRTLVKTKQMTLSGVVTAIMKNKVPVGAETEWAEWKDNKERDISWEIKSIPRLVKTLDDLKKHLRPLILDESGDQNEKVRSDFVERIQRYSGLSMEECEYFAMSGGEVTISGKLGDGWYKVTTGGEVGKYYVINMHEEYEEEDVEDDSDDEHEEDGSKRPRGWWQVIEIPVTSHISELKQCLAVTNIPSPRSVECLAVAAVHVMYAGRLLEECKFKDEEHLKEEGQDVPIERTLLIETETMITGKDAAHKPRALCYLCGLATVTPSSLKWHIHKCEASFDAAQMRRTKERRKKRPRAPVLPTPSEYGPLLDAWNREAALIYLMESSPRCRGCGRSYQQRETLEKHMTKCCPHLLDYDVQRGPIPEIVMEPASDVVQDHRFSQQSFALCYICNRYTGIASLSWHLRSCGRMFSSRQLELPEPLRRNLAEPPSTPLPTAVTDVEPYNEEARVIHAEEVLPYCPSCHEVISTDLFGFSLMQHMSLCCPDLLARIEESVLPSIQRTRRGVMGAICILCNQQYGLAGYGWHLSACYRKYRIRESLLTSHEKEGNFYVRVRVKTQLGLEEVQHNIMEHLATETPEESITLVGIHQIKVTQVSETQVSEMDVLISRLRSLDVARAVKKKLHELENESFVLGKSYISRARPPNPPGSPLTFNPERAWETQWGNDKDESPPEYSQTEAIGENQSGDNEGGVSDGVSDDENGIRDDPPAYGSSMLTGWLPRQYGFELDEYNRKVAELRRGWLPFCPLCNTTAATTEDVVAFDNETVLRIHMEQCCPRILELSDEFKQHRHEKASNFNGTPFAEEVGIVCFLCGQRTVNLTSFPWHLSACVRVWYVAELCKPKRQRRSVPRLPPHVKLPQLDLVDQREVYSNQVREYNNEALKLFNSVGTLQCPACISKQNKQKSEAVDNAITDKGEAVVDASAPPSGPRVFKRASALLSHMDKCCPELVPGSNNADVREAMEKMQNGVDLMGYIAEHCEQLRRNSHGPAHIGIVCHLCNRLCASLAGLEFHRRACMRAWDSMERATRAPHRRRLFSWKKDEVQLQEVGEKYGKDKFYWDVPLPDVGINSELVKNAINLKTPKPHRQPGPVPKPPTTILPPPPSLFNNLSSSNSSDTVFPTRKAYLELVTKYNKEASQIFTDWQPHCPNFKYIAIKLNRDECGKLVNSPLSALKLDKLTSALKIVTLSDSTDDTKLKTKLRVGDTLWSVFRRTEESGWESKRLTGEAEQVSDIIANFATLTTADNTDNKNADNSDNSDDGDNDAAIEPSMVIYVKRGCVQSYATVTNLNKHMDKCCPEMLEQLKLMDASIPDPNADKPIDESTLPGTLCYVCSRRVLYLGSIPRHTAKCYEHFDSLELDKKLVSLRERPPIPPEHVYGITDSGEFSTLRATVKRYKAGHRYMSSENEWRYDVNFNFFGALSVDSQEVSNKVRETCKRANFAIRTLDSDSDSDSDDSDSDSDESDEEDITEVQVLVVTKSSQYNDKEGKEGFELCAGDEVVVSKVKSKKAKTESVLKAMRLLAVKWPPTNKLTPAEALDILQPIRGGSDVGYVLHVKRCVKSPIAQGSLWCSMKASLKEWSARCSDLILSKQPRCGRRVALTRTLLKSQLSKVKFILNKSRSPEVKDRVPDDEGVLLPGDILVTYGATGTSQVRLAHGVPPSCLVEALEQSCELSKTGEVTLQLVRIGLRPAFALGLKNTQWCEKIEKRVDDMEIKEVKDTLARLYKCGLEEATQTGDRLQRRDRLKECLKGGCGRSFATQLTVFKHMKDCCPDVIDPDALTEDPLAAAARTLGVQSDAGLQGVDQDYTRFPHGQPGWICYLCGERSLSLPSFRFHLQACMRAWDNYELGKHPSRWRPPPKPPTAPQDIPPTYSAQLKEYNKQAQVIFNSTMALCPSCSKTFKSEDALDRHMNECCPDILKTLQPDIDRDPIGNDYTLPCHICGRRLVSSDSLKLHIKTCLRAWYRREKDGKLPYERLDPPPPPSLPIPTSKADIPAYRAEAIGIFEASLPSCGLNTKFPVDVKALRKFEKDLFGSQEFGNDENTLLFQDKITQVLTVAKVSKVMTRFTGLRRYDTLLAIVNQEGDDWLALQSSLKEAYDVFASTSEGYVWFERRCTLTFQDEVRRDKHRVSCRTAMVAGLLIPTEINGDKVKRPDYSKEVVERSVYKSYGVKQGRNEFVDTQHARVPVYGDSHNLHARGALQRRQDDQRIAKENAMIASKISSVPPTVPKPSTTSEHSRSKFEAVSKYEKERIDRENHRLGKALRGLYSKHMPVNKNYGGVVGDATRIVRYYEGYAHKRIEGEDYSGAASQVHKWETRTRIYHNPMEVKASKSMETPKTLGVAACSGCGIKRFHGDHVSLRRCCGVFLPQLPKWLLEEGTFAERLQVSLKFLNLKSDETNKEEPLFGGKCIKNTDITDVPWYCDDVCSLAGWLTHSQVCLHRPKFNGHSGLAAKTEDPWVLKGSKYVQGITGEVRRYLLRAHVVVKYASGTKEVIKELDRFVSGRSGEDVKRHKDYEWLKPKLICRVRRINAKGQEKLVEVKIVKCVLKPTTKELMDELGRLVIEDEDLYAKVKGVVEPEVVLEEGLRCYYCYDEIRNNETFNQHVQVCGMRWRRMEARKPFKERRPEPVKPSGMERPTDVNDTEQVTKWAAAAKDAMGPLDGYNPNGGGALEREEEAEARAGGVAAYQQLNIAMDHMDNTVSANLRHLDALQRRMAWEASGGGSETALRHGAALQSEKYGEDEEVLSKRLNKTLARTLRNAEEREQITHPTPVSYDVMGRKSVMELNCQ